MSNQAFLIRPQQTVPKLHCQQKATVYQSYSRFIKADTLWSKNATFAFACMIDWVRLNCVRWNSSFSSNHRMKSTVSSAIRSYIMNVSICECSQQWAIVLSAIVLPINSPRSPLSCFTVRFTFILKEKNSISRFHHSSVYSPPSLWKKPSLVFFFFYTFSLFKMLSAHWLTFYKLVSPNCTVEQIWKHLAAEIVYQTNNSNASQNT